MHVGCFTHTAGGHARGIHTFRADGAELEPTVIEDPSYLVVHPDLPVLYALQERDPTHVAAYRIEADGQLSLIDTIGTEGNGGCHLALDATRRFLVVAHYAVGSVSVLALGPDGSLTRLADTLAFTGSGPNADRQEAAHAHMVVADGDELLVPDLGSDLIRRLRLSDHGAITQLDPITVPPGTGPRHLVLAGDHLVLAGELSATLWLARRTPDGWHGVAEVAASGVRLDEPIYPSAIVHTDDDRVIVANRGADTFAVFALDRMADTLTLLSETGTSGAWPRDLTWHHDLVWVANQNSDTVTVFAPGPAEDESWHEVRRYPCPSPGCIVFTDV